MIKLGFSLLTAFLLFSPAQATQVNSRLCALGYDKRDFLLRVPTSTETALLFTTLDKPCLGPVIIRLSVATAVYPGSFVKVTLRARCTATGGYANSCTQGQLIHPLGNVANLAGNTGGLWETHSYEFIIEHQKPGIWKYELMLNADRDGGKGFVRERTMVVEAFPE
jgi:hypothetical protein